MQKPLNDWYIIVNPYSGTHHHWNQIKKDLKYHKVLFSYLLTKSKNDIDDIVSQAVKKGYRKFMAVGGDGSCHVLINAMMRQDIVETPELTFANFTCGTGNDWQRGRNWPKKYSKQIDLILKNEKETMDIGCVTYLSENPNKKHYFLNMLGLSYDAYVVQQINANYKKKIGALIYILSVIKYIFQYEIPIIELAFNNQVIRKKMYTVNVGLGTHAGSGMELCPHSRDRKDKFAILIANHMSKLRVLRESIRFYTGTILKSSKIESHFTSEITAKGISNPLLLEAEGEPLPTGNVKITILNNALNTIKV